VIAAATVLMALVQIGVLVAGLIAVKRMQKVLVRVEDSVRPVLAHVDDLVVDATESIAAVRAQLDRVEGRPCTSSRGPMKPCSGCSTTWWLRPARGSRRGWSARAYSLAHSGATHPPALSRAFRSAVG
jgi:hypothetical protein